MRKPLKIGNKNYKFKKDAIAYYRTILNSYEFGESLNDSDYYDIVDLLDFFYLNNQNSDSDENIIDSNDQEDDLIISDIKVAKVQFNTKCFELFYSDNTSIYISYLMIINQKSYTPEKLFYIACRSAVHNDIRAVKQKYFDDNSIKGQVKCQETCILSRWTELVLDHRQPNTFSVIVDRFKEVNHFNLDEIEYTSSEQNHLIFKNENLANTFRAYHKEKANLRIVRKECNARRTGMA